MYTMGIYGRSLLTLFVSKEGELVNLMVDKMEDSASLTGKLLCLGRFRNEDENIS